VGFFPTNILINFDERRPFDRKGGDTDSDVQFGDLHLPEDTNLLDRRRAAQAVWIFGYRSKFPNKNIRDRL